MRVFNATELPKDQYGIRCYTDRKPRVFRVMQLDDGYHVIEPNDFRNEVKASWGKIPLHGGLIEVDAPMGVLTEVEYAQLLESLGLEKVPDYAWRVNAAKYRAGLLKNSLVEV